MKLNVILLSNGPGTANGLRTVRFALARMPARQPGSHVLCLLSPKEQIIENPQRIGWRGISGLYRFIPLTRHSAGREETVKESSLSNTKAASLFLLHLPTLYLSYPSSYNSRYRISIEKNRGMPIH